MRKFIALGMLIGVFQLGGLLLATPQVSAVTLTNFQGGIGDPVSLIASGALIPFLNNQNPLTGTIAYLEILSPVGFNDGSANLDGDAPFTRETLHAVFFNDTCTRVTSRYLPTTRDDVTYLNITAELTAITGNGLAGIAASPGNSGIGLVPLDNPILVKMFLFDVGTGQSRVLEPISIDTFDYPTGSILDPSGYSGGPTVWSPLRTGAAFFSPKEGSTGVPGQVNTRLILVCPRSSIQGDNTTHNATTGAFPQVQPFDVPALSTYGGFPGINHPFNSGLPASAIGGFTLQGMNGIIYDDNEQHLVDFSTSCDCVTELSVNTLDPVVYKNLSVTHPAPNGTVTEIYVTSTQQGSFTGYKQSFTVGAAINNFHHRLGNGNKFSLQGVNAGMAQSLNNAPYLGAGINPTPGLQPTQNFR
jgi:hypothetical protein